MKNKAKSAAERSTVWPVAEAEALRCTYSEAIERLRVARRARSIGELLRDQWDLLPCTAARLRSNFQRRRELVLGLIGVDRN